jgi:hypothetical protein
METLPAFHISHHFQKASDICWLPARFLKKIKVLVLRKSTRKDSCWFDITVAVNPWVKTLPSLANIRGICLYQRLSKHTGNKIKQMQQSETHIPHWSTARTLFATMDRCPRVLSLLSLLCSIDFGLQDFSGHPQHSLDMDEA